MSLPVGNFQWRPVTERLPFITESNGGKRYNLSFTDKDITVIAYSYMFFQQALDQKSERAFYMTLQGDQDEFDSFLQRHFSNIAHRNRINLAEQIHELWMKTREYGINIAQDSTNPIFTQKLAAQLNHTDEMSHAFRAYYLIGETFAPFQMELILKFAQTLFKPPIST